LSIKKIDNLDHLESLYDDWEKVPSEKKLSPLNDYYWLVSSARLLTHRKIEAFIVTDNDNNISAIAPLACKKDYFDYHELLGIRFHFEPGDFYYTNDSSLSELAEALSISKFPLELRRISAESKTISALRDAYRNRAIVIMRDCKDYPFIEIDPGKSDIDEQFSARLRIDLRRAMRKAENMGKVVFEIYSPRTEEEFLSLYEKAVKIESHSWKGKAGTALLHDREHWEFYRQYGIFATREGVCRIALMYIDSKAVAMQFAVQQGGRYWLLKIGHDEKYAKCSPGMLLMHQSLRYAKEQDLESFEFLGTTEAWTHRWTEESRSTVRLNIFPYSLTGITAFFTWVMNSAWNKTKNALG
jgi:hypothetical protein